MNSGGSLLKQQRYSDSGLFPHSGLLSVKQVMENYDEIYEFLYSGKYPDNFTKNQTRLLQFMLNHTLVKNGLLYYSKDGNKWKQVPRSDEEKERILRSCHGSVESLFYQCSYCK